MRNTQMYKRKACRQLGCPEVNYSCLIDLLIDWFIVTYDSANK